MHKGLFEFEISATSSIPMNMEHWTECSEFDQDPRQKKHEKAGYPGIRRLIVSQTNRFNFTLYDCTSDF
jgi:hypothetical protein